MVKAGLLEPQSPAMETHIPRHGMSGRGRQDRTVSLSPPPCCMDTLTPEKLDISESVNLHKCLILLDSAGSMQQGARASLLIASALPFPHSRTSGLIWFGTR